MKNSTQQKLYFIWGFGADNKPFSPQQRRCDFDRNAIRNPHLHIVSAVIGHFKKTTVKQLMTILTALIFTTLSYGQNGVRECGSTHYSMDYKPIIVKSILGLPKNIQDSIKCHLLKKLGSDFYELLSLESCLVIDYKELVRLDPKVLNYKWIVPKYDMGFYITQKQTGIKYCCSRMTLDSSGTLINTIDFPDYKINPKSTRQYRVTGIIDWY